MKNLLSLLCCLLIGGIFIFSCDKIDELTEVDFKATYDADLEVESYSRDANGDFYAFATINPSSNQDFHKNKDKIKEINILSVSGEVLSLNKDFKLNANLSIYSDNYTADWSESEFPMYVGAVLTLGNENKQWDNVRNIANEKAPYHVSISGNTSEDDLSFTLRVTIKYKIKAKN